MTPAQIEACVDAAAAALQLPLAPEHRPGVLRFHTHVLQLAGGGAWRLLPAQGYAFAS